MLCQFCQSVLDALQSCTLRNEGRESTLQIPASSLLDRAAYLTEEIERWNDSIPFHWRRQFQIESFDKSLPSAFPVDPWTIAFLATTHSAQLCFYVGAISCCQRVLWGYPEFGVMNDLSGIVELIHVFNTRVDILLRILCHSVSSTIAFIDDDDNLEPMRTATFANSNALIWPMWVVISCPHATSGQKNLCRRVLGFIGQTMGHSLALLLSDENPSA